MKKLFVLVSLFVFGSCGENSVSINVKNVANTISDRFISYEVKFSDLMNQFVEQKKSFENLGLILPSYLKLEGLAAYLRDENRKYDEKNVAAVFERLSAHQIIPIIAIEYQSINFDPLNIMRELKKAQSLSIKECIWQLGDNGVTLNDTTSVKKYVEDLKTLKLLCESVNKERDLKWSVAADGNLRRVERLPFEVTGVEVRKLSRDDVISKSAIATSKLPTWVTVEDIDEQSTETTKKGDSIYDTCDRECLTDGLVHAQLLGEAAKKGISVVIFNETAQQPGKSNFFKQAVSILHKKLVGNKVFNVKVTKSGQDGKSSSLYSYCSKKTSGAVTLMGINFSNMRSKINVKFSMPVDSNAVVLQYMLSAIDGHVMLNNERFSQNATPSYKFKKPSKYSIPLVLPPFSMAFWTIKNAKVDECLNVAVEEEEKTKPMTISSSDQLLKKLVANEFEVKLSNKLEKVASRSKRQISGSSSFLPGLEWELPTFKFPNLLATASNQKPVRDVLFNQNADVYKVGAAEPNPLQPSDNPTLPKGDVYLMINDGKRPAKLATHDYVTDDVEPAKPVSRRRSKANRIMATTEAPDYFMPHDYFDASEQTTKRSSKKLSKKEQPQEIGELFEAEHAPAQNPRNADQRSYSSNIELSTVVKELPPTLRQSKAAMRAAKNKWDSKKILEFLKEGNFEGVNEKAQLGNTDNFEMIDLTENADAPAYDEYEDEEDDEFFRNDNFHHVRTRRDVNFAKNEIPKFGSHIFVDDDEDSIETLVDDVHLYLQPHQPRSENVKEAANDVRKTDEDAAPVTEASTTIKAIDFFSKSLSDAINVAHRTFVGWWYVFQPNEM